MKHVKVLSTVKPATAQETAWLEFKNVFRRLDWSADQREWAGSLIDDYLQK